jgi:4-hydroxy-3-polyprenylbenzoate decarboxylase
MQYQGLRDWIEKVDALGELRRLPGAHWNLEIGAITEIVARDMDAKWALLFDEIPDYPSRNRILTNYLESIPRLALTVGFPTDLDTLGFLTRWREFSRNLTHVAPVEVRDGPIFENVRRGGEIDVLKLPVPQWHEHDGGRYIGTGDCVITQDPDTGWVNVGTYRIQVLGPDRLAIYAGNGQHGRFHINKYLHRGKPAPIAIMFGQDPVLGLLAGGPIPNGVSEYDYAGGVRGRPYEVVRGPHTGLPILADAEIVIEGEIVPGDEVMEGPYGEFTGYYSGQRSEPVITVKNLMYRDDPILVGAHPARPPHDHLLQMTVLRIPALWNQIEAAGVPDVRGVWLQHPGLNYFTVVSISQRYAGHAKQAALIASQCASTVRYGKWVVVVDDDIDPTNIKDVLWAMSTRCDPERDIEIQRDSASIALDPMAHDNLSSKVIINACKPFGRLRTFPRTAEVSAELRRKVLDKWERILRGGKVPTSAEALAGILAPTGR